jgi:hypothetical protein
LGFHSFEQIFQVRLESSAVLLFAHTVDAWGFVWLQVSMGFEQQLHVHLVMDAAEWSPSLLLNELRYPVP